MAAIEVPNFTVIHSPYHILALHKLYNLDCEFSFL